MGLTLTYDSANARVRIDVAGLPTILTTTALIERSVDQIVWTTVRGCAAVPVTAGVIAPATFYDYEFASDVTNYYRLSLPYELFDAFGRTVAAGSWGVADSGQTYTNTGTVADASVSGGTGRLGLSVVNVTDVISVPIGAADQDVYLSISNAVNPATSSIKYFFDVREISSNTLYRVNVTLTTGLAVQLDVQRFNSGTPTVLQTALTIAGLTPTTPMTFRVQIVGNTLRVKAWATASSEPVTWSLTIVDSAPLVGTGDVRVAAFLSGGNTNTLPVVIQFDNYTISDFTYHVVTGFTANLTPALAQAWLKSTARSFLNIAPTIVDYEEPSRDSRGGHNFVDARTLPIAQVELMSGRKLNLVIRTTALNIARQWEFLIASGDTLFLHVPASSPITGGYFRVDGSMGSSRPWAKAGARYFTLPLVEVAAPGPDVVSAQATWDTLMAQYGTFDNLLALINTSWDQYYALIGNPTEVIVP